MNGLRKHRALPTPRRDVVMRTPSRNAGAPVKGGGKRNLDCKALLQPQMKSTEK